MRHQTPRSIWEIIIDNAGAIVVAIIGGIFLLMSEQNRIGDIILYITPSLSNPTVTTSPVPTHVYITALPQQSPTATIMPTVPATETSTLYPTETPTVYPTETPTAYPTETSTVYPTETPTIYPTETPVARPTDTPISGAVPATTLELGETWEEDGLELTLSGGAFTKRFPPGGVILQVILTNRRTQDVSFRWPKTSFSAKDNHGTPLEMGLTSYFYYEYGYYFAPLEDIRPLVKTDQSIIYSHSYYDAILVKFDLSDSSITDITFTISNVSSITKAQWRVPGPSH